MNQKKPVSVVVTIPAYNEAATVAEVIKAVPKHIDGVESVDIAVINDGSTDDTADIAAKAGAN